MDKITLIKSPTGWQCIFEGPHAAEIISLFHTNNIPAPYTTEASPELVLREVQAKNPGVLVVLA